MAHDPGARLRDLAASLGITERSAHGIVTDLATAGYVVKQKDGRRNRHQVQAHMPLPEAAGPEPAIEVLAPRGRRCDGTPDQDGTSPRPPRRQLRLRASVPAAL